MNEQTHYKQDKTITRQSINVKRHIFNVIGDIEEFEERDLNIRGDLHGSILHDHTQRLDALPPTLVADIDRDVRELYTRSRVVRDEIFSQRYMFRSLEREQERAIVTFGALWRLVLALEAWAGRAAMQRELQEMRGRVTALEQERDGREQYMVWD
ncbi:hypothetical protein Tco_0638288 [Tanacetum coccineum]